ncbi:MAG: hypothetical protein WD512_17910, partial [Candidatus Paceibacterota bacterium]
ILDKERKNWFNEIDLSELNMSHCSKCVLGQIFGSFWSDTSIYILNKLWHKKLFLSVGDVSHDLEVYIIISYDEYTKLLKKYWITLINKRRK